MIQYLLIWQDEDTGTTHMDIYWANNPLQALTDVKPNPVAGVRVFALDVSTDVPLTAVRHYSVHYVQVGVYSETRTWVAV